MDYRAVCRGRPEMSRRHKYFSYASLCKAPLQNFMVQNNDLSFLMTLRVRNSGRTWLGIHLPPVVSPCCEVTNLLGWRVQKGLSHVPGSVRLPYMATVLPHGWFGFLCSTMASQGSRTSYMVADPQERKVGLPVLPIPGPEQCHCCRTLLVEVSQKAKAASWEKGNRLYLRRETA